MKTHKSQKQTFFFYLTLVSGTAKTGLLEVNDVASKNEFKVDVIFLHLQLNFNYKIMISIVILCK